MNDYDIAERLDRLESLVEKQQKQIEDQQATIKTQQFTIEQQRERIAERTEGDNSGDGVATDDEHGSDDQATVLNRRSALKAGGLLALLFGVTGTASANPQGQVGTSKNPLKKLYTEELNGGVTGDTTVTRLTGSGLTVNGGALGLTGTETDTANTFNESNVSMTTTAGTTVSNGAIEYTGNSTATRPDDDTTLSSTSTRFGLRINPNSDLSAIEVTVSSNTSGSSTVSLTDSSGNELTSEPFPGTNGTVKLTSSLSAGTDYHVFIEGSGHTPGYYEPANFPFTSTLVDIVEGVSDAGTIVPQGDAYAFKSVTGIGAEGTATVGFSRPSSVTRWETATFDTDLDGGTVEVYVETSSDGGSSWSEWRSKPIGSGTDLSSIPSSDYVRFRAEFSADGSSTPRLTMLSRQYRS